MARSVGRVRTAPMPGLSSPSISEDGSAASSPRRTPTGGGRAGGMIRTAGSGMNFTPMTTAHSAALGRGHNQSAMISQNFRPFLDNSYFVQRAGSSVAASHASFDSTISKSTSNSGGQVKAENFIYLDIDVILKDDSSEESVANKTLGFDMNQQIRSVMNEVCGYIDLEGVKPFKMICTTNGATLEDGTLSSNGVQNEFQLELHLKRDIASAESEDGINRASGGVFLDKMTPNSISLCFMIFNTGKQLLMKGNILPTVEISRENTIVEDFGPNHKQFIWTKNVSFDWEVPYLEAINTGVEEDRVFSPDALEKNINWIDSCISSAADSKANSSSMKALKFRKAFFEACLKVSKTLKLNRFGYMYFRPIKVSAVQNCKVLVGIQFNAINIEGDILREHGLKFRGSRNLQPNIFKIEDDKVWALFFQYYQRQRAVLAPGVYIGYLKVRNTIDSMRIMTLTHNPDLIPVTRFRGGIARNRLNDGFAVTQTSSMSQTSSRMSISRTTTADDTEFEKLSETEIKYIRFLAEKEYNPVELPPPGLKITPELEKFGEQVKKFIKVLATQVGVEDLDLSHMSQLAPIELAGDVQIILLAPPDDLQAQSAAPTEKKKGLLGRLGGLGMSKKKEEDSDYDNGDEGQYFSFLPVPLFEAIHHHNYTNSQYSSFRGVAEDLQMDALRFDLNDTAKLSGAKTHAPGIFIDEKSPGPSTLSALNEHKKKWNDECSWVTRIINTNREVLKERRMGAV